MLILRTINLSFRFNISFASVNSLKLWPFSSFDRSSAVDVTGRSKFKQKYLGCEAVLASQCTEAVLEKQTHFFQFIAFPPFLRRCVGGAPDKKHTKSR